MRNPKAEPTGPEKIALVLRVGMGLVLLAGGISKLSQLLYPDRQAAILESYWGATGYVNAFLDQYLFEGPAGSFLTPWAFLTGLSAFELVSGCMLLAGFLVRPLAVVWGFMFWSFVAALPVVTAVGVDPDLVAYRSPAILVLARDVGLSGLFFLLFSIGAGSCSVDRHLMGEEATRRSLNWDASGLLLRLSLALPLLVGGAFHGLNSIQSFGIPAWVLLLLGMALLLNVGVRVAGGATALGLTWLILTDFDLSRSLIANMNVVKREYAFLAAAIVLGFCGGGRLFSVLAGRAGLIRLMKPGLAAEAEQATEVS